MIYFIFQQCLTYYNNSVESVIEAVLEANLPPNLEEIDRTLPYIPPEPMVK
jgi:phage tail protein X